MALSAKIKVKAPHSTNQNLNINIINPHYPINGRMCTLEDLFIEYNQLNLLNHSYRLLAPDKDLCPSVQDIYNDNVKVYYIEEGIYQELQKEDASIYFYNYANPHSIAVSDSTTDDVSTQIYTRETSPSDHRNGSIRGNEESNGEDNGDFRETVAEVYKQFTKVGQFPQVSPKYANYWAIYMRDDLFTSYIRDRMILYFNTNEVTENDSKDILFNILATKIRDEQRALGKDVFLAELSIYSSMWINVGNILADFFEDVFLNLTYKNEHVFYSANTAVTGIKALNIITEYWKKIDPNFNPNQKKCRYNFQIAQDRWGYYIKTTSPIEVKKYLARNITDVNEKGDTISYIKYINMNDIEDMALQLLHWIQKNFIYLPYHIPNLGVNTNGTQQVCIDTPGRYDGNYAPTLIKDIIKLDNPYNSVDDYQYDLNTGKLIPRRTYLYGKWPDNNNYNKWDSYYKAHESQCLIRMCDVQPGFIVFSDATDDYTDSDNGISTKMSNTAFLHNQTNTSNLNNYALSPGNYITLNAEFEEKYYAYICSVDIGDNDKDILKITPANNVKYVMQKTYYERTRNNKTETFPIYNIAFVPSKDNTSGNIITYTSTIYQSLSGITKTITFKHYPTQFIVFPELNKLSSKYFYDIERFTITSPVVKTRLLDVNYNKFTDTDVDKKELVIYQHELYQIMESVKDTNNAIIALKLKHVYDPSENYSPFTVDKDNMQNLKRLNQTTSNTYYLLSYMTETQDLTKEITMEISIAVYEMSKYNQWKQYGYWTDDTKNINYYKLLPLNNNEIAREDSCNVIINFYEIDNYNKNDQELVTQNKNSLHKYVAGRTDMEVDTQFNTMKFSNTATVSKNVQPQFATGYTSWMNGKKIRLSLMQHIDTDAEQQSTTSE